MFVAFLALPPAGRFLLPRQGILITCLGYVIALGFVLVGICWMKGQPRHDPKASSDVTNFRIRRPLAQNPALSSTPPTDR